MTESASVSAEDAAAARAAEQARLRKERREAKIKAGGASRLNRITGLGGGLQRDQPTASTSTDEATTTGSDVPTASASQPTSKSQEKSQQPHADPDEVDISQHYYAPRTTARIPSSSQGQQAAGAAPGPDAAALRQLMLGMDRPGGQPGGMPADGAQDDPMMRTMIEMLGGGANGSGPGGFPGMPGGGANPFAQGGLGPQQQPQQTVVPDWYASLWRLLHTAVALGLGLFITLWTSFGGTRTEREEAAAGIGSLKGGRDGDGADDSTTSLVRGGDAEFARQFFYAFATAEALLLTTRFFLDRGRAPPSGVLWTVSSFLPQPIRGYIEIGLRYGQIFSTVKADILVCIFVLGVCSWLRS